MKMELVLHGVPQGHKVWGGAPDKYYESFYGSNDIYNDANSLMVTEIRKCENVYCSYYTLIRYKRVNAENGRSGSYFGLTFKVNGKYCIDVYSLYDLMTQIYSRYIVNVILAKEGESEKYIIEDFSAVDGQIKEATKVFMDNIQSHLRDDFVDIDPKLQKKYSSKIMYYNLDDVNSETFFKDTLNSGRILVSPEYPTKDMVVENVINQLRKGQDSIKGYQTSVEQLTVQNKVIPGQLKKIQDLAKELEEANSIIEKYKNDFNEKNIKIKQLEQSIISLNKELNSYKSSENVKKLVSSLEGPLNELVDILKGYRNSEDMDNSSSLKGGNKQPLNKKFSFKFLGLGIFAILLIGLLGVGISGKMGNKDLKNNALNEKEQIISTLSNEKNSLMENIKKLQFENEELISVVKALYKEARIDLKEYKKGAIKLGEKFTLSLKNAPNLGGIWEVKGFSIDDKSVNNTFVSASEKGSAIVSYCVGGVEVASRDFEIK